MSRRRLWASTPLLFLFLAPALAVVEPDFSFYPASAQPCLNQAAAASKCVGSTVTDLNNCLCGNWNDFVILAATCIGKSDKDDAVTVYKTMVSACADSDTPLDVAPSEFYGAVNGDMTTTTTTSTSATATTMATAATTDSATQTDVHIHSTATLQPTSSSTAAPAQETLSTGATIGIALGASFGGVGSIAGLVYFLLRRSKKQDEEARHPMLPEYGGGGGGGGDDSRFSGQPPAPEPTPSPGLLSNYSSEVKQTSWVSPLQSPDYRYSAATWDGTQGAYQGPLAPTGAGSEMVLPLQAQGVGGGVEPNTTGMVFEMDATASEMSSGPVEVQGNVPSELPEGRL